MAAARPLSPFYEATGAMVPAIKGIPAALKAEEFGDNELYKLANMFESEYIRKYLKINGGWRMRPVSRHDGSNVFDDDSYEKL